MNRFTLVRWLPLLLLALLASPALAHNGMHHAAALGASAAIAPDGRLWVVDVHGQHVRVRHSDDQGQHFSTPVIVNQKPADISASGENRPKIALGPQGDIYVSWTEPLAKPYTGRIRFARSIDGGQHFSTPITVHHDRAVITHRFDALTVDSQGRIVVTWIDKRDLQAATAEGKPYAGAAVYMAWSDDRGASFAPEQKLADHSCECCRIAMATAPDGRIGVLWRAVYPTNIRDHAYAVLKAGKIVQPAQRATFSQWQIAGCPHQGPGLAIAADGTRHATWMAVVDGQPHLWYGQLDPGHKPQHLIAIAGNGAAHADVAVAGNSVWVTWNQVDAKGLALMVRRSSDGGKHFGKPRRIAHTIGNAGSPQLLVHAGKVWAAWNTSKGFRFVPLNAPPRIQPLTAADVPALIAPPAKGTRVIAMWALDCAWCMDDLKTLVQWQRHNPQIQLVSVATDNISARAKIAQRLHAAGLDDLPTRAYAGTSAQRMNYLIDHAWVGATPHTIVIHADGRRDSRSGVLSVAQLQALIK